MQILRFIATMLFSSGFMIFIPSGCYYANNKKRTLLACFVLGLLMIYSGLALFVYLSTI